MGATGYVRNERTIKPSLSIDDLDILARSGQSRAIKRRYIVVWGGSFFLVCALCLSCVGEVREQPALAL